MTVALSTLAPSAGAQFIQRTWLPWRTIETEHFAFHYPVDLETWTRHIAEHIEAIDSAVSRGVGYTPAHKTHIVVDDPYEIANGSAWTFIDQPIIDLWATPPDPRDDIGEFRVWDEMLVSHEFSHVAHLTRPSRNAFMRTLWSLAPVNLGPIAQNAPRWAIEGYATYMEGKVTGSGRPHGVWRPAFLRRWALEGQLPRYEQLDAWGAYEGGEATYLVGSAFLEWLAQRQGDSSLVYVWRRMTAKQDRTFDEAFTGVFGESARTLYGYFTAALTERARQAARIIAESGAADTGAIIQRLSWNTGDPAVSRDGKQLAIVLHSPVGPSRVVVWSTATEPDTGRAKRDSILRARDPEDVPARTIFPPPKRVLASLRSVGSAWESPRFLRDGRVLLGKNAAQGDGTLRPDLYIWNTKTGITQRITHDASVRDADPSPDGRTAAAVQCAHGWCDLVSVDLATGAVTTVLSGSPERSFYRPRISPVDGNRVLVAVHDTVRWHIAVVDVVHRSMRVLDFGDAADRFDAAWIDSTYAADVSDAGGVDNVELINLPQTRLVALTRVTGAAVAPEPAPNGVYFLSMYSRGYDLRRIAPTGPGRTPFVLADSLAPAVAIPPLPATRFATNPVSEPHAFGFAPRSFRWVPIPTLDADGVSAGIAVASNDIIGRSDLLARAIGGTPSEWQGASADFVWRGTRPAFRASVFDASQQETQTRSPIMRPFAIDSRIAGGEVAADAGVSYETWGAHLRAGAGVSRVSLSAPPLAPASTSSARPLLFGDGAIAFTQRGDLSSTSETFGASTEVGRSFDTRFFRSVGTAALSTTATPIFPLTASALYGRTSADASVFEQFSIGGASSPLMDRTVLEQRIAVPVLPSGTITGTSVFSYKISLDARPLSWYWWAGSITPVDTHFQTWQRVLGVEWTAAEPAIATVGTPAARAVIGVGESLDTPFAHRIRAYVNLILNP